MEMLGPDMIVHGGDLSFNGPDNPDDLAFGRICLEAFERNPGDFGRTVMDLLERDYGLAPLEEALQAPLEGRKALATATR